MEEEKDILKEIEEKIGYVFNNKCLLIQAITHSSFSNEHPNFPSYERLEFVGDAAVEYVISLFLIQTYPNAMEGVLSQKRASLVNAGVLSKITENLGLAQYLKVGACDIKSNIKGSAKIKCDIFEAIAGAILIDSNKNLEEVSKFILSKITPFAEQNAVDYKSKVMENCAKNGQTAVFEVIDKDEYAPFFKVQLTIDGEIVAEGEGRKIKIAEKQASKRYLQNKID